MSSAPAPAAWWSTTADGLSLRAKVGTFVLALCLVVVTVIVWTSPSSSPVTAEAGQRAMTVEDELRAEVAALRGKLAEESGALTPRAPLLIPPVVGATEDSDPGKDDKKSKKKEKKETEQRGSGTTRDTRAPEPRTGAPSGSRSAPRTTVPVNQTSDGPANPRNPVLPGPGPSTGSGTGSKGPTPTPKPGGGTQQPGGGTQQPGGGTQQPGGGTQQPGGGTPMPVTPPAPAPIVTPSLAELINPSHRYYGMYTVQSPFNWATLDDVATKTRVLPDVAGYFSGWDKDFRPDAVERSWRRGMLPLLTWESRPSHAANDQRTEEDYSLPLIIGDPEAGVPGRYDAYIRKYARDIADLGLPLALRLNHEMNGDWYPWSELTKEGRSINGNRPGDYVAMWKHVYEIFEAEGANEHVIWVWAPNIVNNLPDPLKTPEALAGLYPGDEYVDWVGLSGYFRPPYRPGQTPTFEWTFDQSLNQLRNLTSKPIFLAEIGASEVGGQKPQWVKSFFEGLANPKNSDIIGFSWFSLTVTTYVRGERTTNDWRVDSRADSLAAFRDGLANPAVRIADRPHPRPTATPTPTPSPSPEPVASPATLAPPAPEAPEVVATPTASPEPAPGPVEPPADGGAAAAELNETSPVAPAPTSALEPLGVQTAQAPDTSGGEDP